MIHPPEELQRLAYVQDRLRDALRALAGRLARHEADITEEKAYLWANRDEMDHVEKVFTREVIQQSVMTGETVLAQRHRLARLLQTPYFGRVDFHRPDSAAEQAIYVGIHHFADGSTDGPLVYDWRAPISTLFYDYEPGPARYRSPAGDVEGDIRRKRQFRIRNGRLEFVLDTAVNIIDDILQEELSRASDDGMRQIVATIQRDQNAIIRDEQARVLIIQGVAGSGKTSVALHRIAFLLYRFRDTLTSKDILLISPNRVFADYISNVLPELGEETVTEIGMDTLADELLGGRVRFQTFAEQVAELLETDDEAMRHRIAVKASTAFLDTLDEYADHVERLSVQATDLRLGPGRIVPDWFLDETWRRHRGVAVAERLRRVVQAVEQQVGIHYNHDLTTAERAEVRKAVKTMYRRPTLRAAYRELFTWMGEPDLLKPAKAGALEYADVFPFIYLKMRLEGVDVSRDATRPAVKHLLIDEMQDYTPVQYAVLGKLFPCRKTILGDANQAINPYSASTAETIQAVFKQAAYVQLRRSFRSTFEITRFSLRIAPNPDVIGIERHGPAPEVLAFRRSAAEIAYLVERARSLADSGHHSLAVICRTERRARRLADALREAGLDVQHLTARSRAFRQGVLVCTAFMAKGLEFDEVIVAEVTAKEYRSDMDRNLLYVACTRAMHRLTLTHVGPRSPWVPDVSQPFGSGPPR